MKGVISFLVASVFLLVLVSSASKLSERAPDVSYQPLVAMHLQQEAVKAAFSDALTDAAGKAIVASQASGAGAEAPAIVKTTVYLAALDFEAQINDIGYRAAFWCGNPTEKALQDASAGMAFEKNAILPEGTLLLSNPACADAFDVNLLRKKVHVRNVGFSIYSKEAEMGHAMRLPEGFEGEIDD